MHSQEYICTTCQRSFAINPSKDLEVLRKQHEPNCKPKSSDESERPGNGFRMTDEQHNRWRKWKSQVVPNVKGEVIPQTSWRKIFKALWPDVQIPGMHREKTSDRQEVDRPALSLAPASPMETVEAGSSVSGLPLGTAQCRDASFKLRHLDESTGTPDVPVISLSPASTRNPSGNEPAMPFLDDHFEGYWSHSNYFPSSIEPPTPRVMSEDAQSSVYLPVLPQAYDGPYYHLTPDPSIQTPSMAFSTSSGSGQPMPPPTPNAAQCVYSSSNISYPAGDESAIDLEPLLETEEKFRESNDHTVANENLLFVGGAFPTAGHGPEDESDQ